MINVVSTRRSSSFMSSASSHSRLHHESKKQEWQQLTLFRRCLMRAFFLRIVFFCEVVIELCRLELCAHSGKVCENLRERVSLSLY